MHIIIQTMAHNLTVRIEIWWWSIFSLTNITMYQRGYVSLSPWSAHDVV